MTEEYEILSSAQSSHAAERLTVIRRRLVETIGPRREPPCCSGDAVGEAIAKYVNHHSMKRLRGGDDDDRR